jgi:preprotein translocase subunit YajC
MSSIWILAQAPDPEAPSQISSERPTEEGEAITQAADSNDAPVTESRRTSPTSPINFILLGLMFVVMYLLLFRGPRKKQQQHKQMVQGLEKNDRVRTIGGIIGTVVDIKGDEVTLKVDESTNTKIKVASSAIGRNLSKDNK